MPEVKEVDHSSGRLMKAFVCGWPVEHSRSPLIHGYWLREHEINGRYEKLAVSPEALEAFIENMKESGFVGGNVTIPHKEVVLKLVDRTDHAARAIGAVNTIWFEDSLIIGGNTDWSGFAENLDRYAAGWDSEDCRIRGAMVLGAGGASRAVVYALKERGFRNIAIANRTETNAARIISDFGCPHPPLDLHNAASWPRDVSIFVNTTSLGMSGQPELPQGLDSYLASLEANTLVTDIVYVPLQTPLIKMASEKGLKTVDGLGMLLHQAIPGFERWFGVKPAVSSELRNLVIKDLGLTV